MLKIPFLHYVLNFVTMFVKGFCSKQNAHHHDSGLLRKMLRATCVISVLLGAFTLPTTSFAWNSSTSYVCGNNGDFPMSFAGCKSGYYYEDLQNATSALTPDEVGECIACPSGYRCTGGFAGAKSITPYEYEGGSSRYDCGVGHFPMFFGGCKAGYYYEDWQSANDMLHPDEVGECIACPAGHTCAGGFAGPVEDYVPKFTITTTYDTDIFTFSMSAAGTFIIDWGDGTFEEIDRTDDTQMATYSHDYDSAGRYVIGFAGLATEYDSQEAAISFSYGKNSTASNIASISGSLGAIFPTLPGDANDSSRYPRFVSTFADATNLKYLPTDSNGNSTLFSGVSGAADYMFNYTFSGCYSLKSIPYGLFSGVSGAAQNMFDSTFYNTRIKSIPADLFSGVSGAADHMFYRTFYECSDLKSIPYGLFSGVSGAADSMFRETFHHTSIKSIPADLFAGVSGAADNMFYRTFDVCYNLTSVPADLFAGVSGTPKPGMFNQTFQYDYSLNEFRYGNDNSTTSYIPPHFFGSIATTPYAADFMRNVFNGTGIATSCPAGTDLYTTGFESYWNGKVSCITRTPFTIKFDLNNGSWPTGVVVPQQYTETGSTVTLPTPKRFGYIFMGWYDNSEFNGHAITNTFGLSDDKTFYAKWEVAKFTITTTDDTDSFKFSMSAAGTFWVDWGDGTIEEIDRTDDTEPTTYSHDYDDAGEYVIGFTGLATEYNDYDGYFDDVNFAAISFGTDEDWFYQHTPGNIASISGSLGAMFPTLPGDADDLSKHPRFPATFAHAENLTLIPSTLFSGVSGAVSYMFDQTFLDCTSLTSLPSGLFSGVSGAANSMFYSTFDGCSSLTSIPSGLFSGVSGAANSMFGYTFYGCSSLESIPSGLFSGVSGAASRMFEETFNGCSGLTSLPSGLFSGVSGAADYMFGGTFSGCTSLTSLPSGLFSGVSGAADSMFSGTFYGCTSLTSLPSGLFSGVSGAADSMFTNTFNGCSSLTSIPSGLFSGVSGAANYMFYQTFYNCTSLTSIPADLFAGVSGTPEEGMFYATFQEDVNLNEFRYSDNSTSSYIPPHFFGSIATTPDAESFMTDIFEATGIATSCPSGTTQYTTGFESYWDDKVSCVPAYTITFNMNDGSWPVGVVAPQQYTDTDTVTLPTPTRENYYFAGWYDNSAFTGNAITEIPSGSTGNKTFYAKWTAFFAITTTPDTNFFKFGMSAAGTFTIDWGDGTIEVIDRTGDTDIEEYDHDYDRAGQYVITFTGLATGYNDSGYYSDEQAPAAISFGKDYEWTDDYTADKIASVSGSLGAVFPTLNDGSDDLKYQPRFLQTFINATNLTSIPSGLFSGVSGAATEMFENTFGGCSGLTSIPSGLFSGVSGAAERMFYATFNGCTSLTSLPTDSNGNSTLFGDVSGAENSLFSNTFYGCTSLTSLPSGLFSGVSGAAHNMFHQTFAGCTSLTSLPSGLFGGVSGAANSMFADTFRGCTSLTSLPTDSNGNSTLFSGIEGAANYMFSYTFDGCTSLESIPTGLFSGVSGAANSMFADTFRGCTSLTSLPSGLFSGVSGAADYMFNRTFQGCTSLTSLPSGLFSGVSGAANYMFSYTFYGCTSLASLPTDSNGNSTLFSGVSGAADYMFNYTFNGCTSLTSLPSGLFSGVSGAANYMFNYTFNGCTSLTSLPTDSNGNSTLFSGVSGAANSMFAYTFRGCTSLVSLPSGLFSGVSGAANSMFAATFYGCSALTSLPTDSNGNSTLFGDVSGAATGLFSHTFYGCSALTSLPSGLFGGVSGTATYMFQNTFYGCSALTSIPANLFAGLSGNLQQSMFNGTFSGDRNLNEFYYSDNSTTSYIPPHFFGSIPSSNIARMSLSSVFYNTGFATSCPSGTVKYTTGFESYWNGKVSCTPTTAYNITFNLNDGSWPTGVVVPQQYTTTSTVTLPAPTREGYTFAGWYDNSEFTGRAIADTLVLVGDKTFYAKWNQGTITPKFTLTTVDGTDSFSFTMSAAGNFLVDCGDGGALTSTANDVSGGIVTRDNVDEATYKCSWSSAGAHTIRFAGSATGYPTTYKFSGGASGSAISFNLIPGESETNAQKIASISGSLGQIFGTVENPTIGQSQPRFHRVFYYAENMTGTDIPDPNNENMNYALPPTLFDGVYGQPIESMFSHTFQGCSGLTGSIPGNLFAGISGAPAEFMFSSTFYGCSGLSGSIPGNLFAGISGAPAEHMFDTTFTGCRNLTGSIPGNLFAGISGAPAASMFSSTFQGCSGLTGSIPGNLFAGISGAPAEHMFWYTFRSCSGLTGSIPGNLFAGISGAPAKGMFEQTFSYCGGLTGSIPGNLFAGISGAPAQYMFQQTFLECSGLTGYIPSTLFAGISTASTAQDQMYQVFYESGLDTLCPSGTELYTTGFESYFDGKVACASTTTYNITFNMNEGSWPTGVVAPQQYTETDTITLPTPKRFGYIFMGWYDNSAFTGNAITNTFGLSGNKTFYAKWETSKFTLTTVDGTDSFEFQISAAGNFLVDCGDGGALTSTASDVSGYEIIRDNLNEATYTCSWSSAGAHTIGFSGNATGYSTTDDGLAAITFYLDDLSNTEKIASISGSLGQIFGTVETPTIGQSQPRFYQTFLGASNMTGTNIPDPNNENMNYALPPTLFNGVYGQPTNDMFNLTFYYCSGLTGSIPSGLFGNLSGTPSEFIFHRTFQECSGLTGSIPSGLFGNLSGAPASNMFAATFQGCSGLTGSIPSGLFGSLSGEPAVNMFYFTFSGCSGLTGSIPGNLFTGVSGAPVKNIFNHTFYNCSGLTGYIQPSLFAGISTESTARNQMYSVFSGSGLDTYCPANTYQYTTGFESYFDGKVACEVCPEGGTSPAGSTSVNQCIAYCPVDHFVPENHPEMCFPHMLHVGDEVVYLSETRKTTPALNVLFDGNVFYANMTNAQTPMTSGSQHYFKAKYNDEIYYIYDDTLSGESE